MLRPVAGSGSLLARWAPALASAALLVASFPPLHLLLPAFVALIPFAVRVEDLPPGPEGARRALEAGVVLGVASFGVLLYWMAVALHDVTVLAVPAYLGTVAVLGLLVGGVGWAAHRLRKGVGLPLWLALPLAWTSGEWIRAHLPGSLAFPWLELGTSLAGFPRIAGVAELVGTRGVGFWLALVSGLGAGVAVRIRDGRRWGWRAAVFVAAAVVPASWGLWRAATLDLRPVARVAVIQPETGPDGRWDPERATTSAREALADLEGRVDPGAVDLVVWPETAFPVRLDAPEGAEAVDFLRDAARRLEAPMLAGAYETASGDGEARHNSAFLVDSAGLTGFVYRKRFLVPVVERTPLVAPPGSPDGLGGLVPGVGSSPGRLAEGVAFGVLICYESAFAGAARDYRAAGADLLVNLTNDAWFGGEAWYERTPGLWQHPAHLVMRAVEGRVAVARSARAGFSFFVDPLGRRYGIREPFDPGHSVATVRSTDVRTLYSRIGDVVGTGAVLLGTAALAFGAARGGGPRSGRPSTGSSTVATGHRRRAASEG